MNHDLVQTIQKILQSIEANLEAPLNRESMIQETFLSAAAFYPLFRSLVGTSLKDYIQRRRLSASCRDLLETDSTILDIALRYQYENYESYSRAFKRLTGTSPRQYRKAGIPSNPFGPITIMKSQTEGALQMKRKMNESLIQESLQSSSGMLLDIDIDSFEAVNQNYGRPAGDFVLMEMQHRINQVLDEFQIEQRAIRIHNDEFLVALPNVPDQVARIAEKLLAKVGEPYPFKADTIRITASIGLTPYEKQQEWTSAVERAEAAMKLAKQRGKNQTASL